jgi:hypothetical protein
MKQHLQITNNNAGQAEPDGPFCPITPQKGDSALKGGALTSAFMSAFL